jgi:hypothetical protein
MFRYRVTAYFEDKATQAQVAQTVVVLAENDNGAMDSVKAEVSKDAIGGRVHALRVMEKELVTPGVKFRGDPYIPFTSPVTRGAPLGPPPS